MKCGDDTKSKYYTELKMQLRLKRFPHGHDHGALGVSNCTENQEVCSVIMIGALVFWFLSDRTLVERTLASAVK